MAKFISVILISLLLCACHHSEEAIELADNDASSAILSSNKQQSNSAQSIHGRILAAGGYVSGAIMGS